MIYFFRPDVYYTTMTEAVEWLTEPTPVGQLTTFKPWDCNAKEPREPPCSIPKSCPLVVNEAKVGASSNNFGTR